MKDVFKIVLAAGAILAGGMAQAQEAAAPAEGTTTEVATNRTDIANNTAFGDWVVQCEAVTVSRTICRVVQELTRTDDDSLVVRFIALPTGPTDAILLAQVPIGAYLPGGAVYRLDNLEDAAAEPDPAEQREMIWQRCLGDLCEAAVAITTEEMAQFTEVGGILFGYRPDIDAEPTIVRADVSRFAEAISAIRTGEEHAAEAPQAADDAQD